MRRLRITAFLFWLMCASPASFAQAPSGLAPTNIVTLSFNAAVLGTAEAQRDLKALQNKFAPREQRLQKLNNDVETARKQLNEGTTKLTEAEKNQRIQDINAKEKQLEREAEDFKNDSQSESQQIFQRIAQKVYTLLQDYSSQHAYSAVLERGSDASPNVWYAAGNVDITEQIIKAYDSQAGVSERTLPDKPAAPGRKTTTPAPR